MRTIIESDLFHVCPSLGATNQSQCTTTTTIRNISPHRTRSNSNSSEPTSILSDDFFLSSSPSSSSLLLPSSISFSELSDSNILDKNDNDIEYLQEYIYPSDDENESSYIDDSDNNDELYLEKHLTRQQFNTATYLEYDNYQRSKRTNKKIKAQRQIKTKHAKSIKIKSHNKPLYIHHRLAKKITLHERSYNYIPSPQPVSLYSFETLRALVYQHRHPYDESYGFNLRSSNQTRKSKPNNNILVDEAQMSQLRDFTLYEHNILDEPSFDDDMIQVLLDMQNRDLSPEDYETLLRLDDRVQRKTLNSNILETLTTIDVTDIHLDEQCTICMENYQHEQKLKLLPCKHMFHANCIETYLKDFSNQCPLDNLPLI